MATSSYNFVIVCASFAMMLGSNAVANSQDDSVVNQERTATRLLERSAENDRLDLERVEHEPSNSIIVQGYFTVPEDRSTGEGRELRIGMIIIPARSPDPSLDPVFILHGGPGAAATTFFRRQVNGWIREQRDVVLIDQRGTGSSNRLQVRMPGSDDDLQGYFHSFFDPEIYLAALPSLQQRADLSQYTTINSIEDFEEIRQALGYGVINLRGGSYGTRSAMVYMRMYPESIRSATLQGIQPISYRNPLPHARGAQNALEMIFDEINQSPEYRLAFPDLEEKFAETLQRLEQEPATVEVNHPTTGEPSIIEFSRDAFAESVRLQLYQLQSNRRLPLMLLNAYHGEFSELANAALRQNRGARGNIAWGMLMCVTASEDLSRIDESEIEAACRDTFLGDIRIRTQMSVAKIWPAGTVPDDFGEPVSVDTPTLLLSGTHDPATTPAWGEEAARHLPNALHVVIPGGHGVFGDQVERLEKHFLESGSARDIDLSEISTLSLPPLVLPE